MTYFPLRQTTCFFIPLVAPCKPLLITIDIKKNRLFFYLNVSILQIFSVFLFTFRIIHPACIISASFLLQIYIFYKKSLRYCDGVLPSVFLNTLVNTR